MNAPIRPLTKEAVAALMSVSKRTIDNWIADETLPMPVQIGRRVYWHPNVIVSWLDERLGHSSANIIHDISSPPKSRGRPRNHLSVQ